jgi:hypothetical protein
MHHLVYRFEEWPLVSEAGASAAEVSGVAELAVHPDGEWMVRHISLDGTRPLVHDAATLAAAVAAGEALPRHAPAMVPLDPGDPLFLRLLHRLEHEARDDVDDAVARLLAEARADRPLQVADRRWRQHRA